MLSVAPPHSPTDAADGGSEAAEPRRGGLGADERQRLRALFDYDVLDTAPELAFDRLAQAAADVCAAPMALISLVDAHRQWFKANIGVPFTETARKVAFCDIAIGQPALLEVRDARRDPRFAANPMVTGGPALRYYAGVPLVTPTGHRVGTLCVLDVAVRPRGLSGRQRRVLTALAAQVVTELEMRTTLRTVKAQQARLERRDFQLRQSVATLHAVAETSRQGAAQYRSLFKLTRVRFWTADADGFLTGVRGQSFAPPGRADTPRRKVRFDFRLHPDDCAPAAAAWTRALAERSPLDHHVRQRQPQGDYRWTRLRATFDAQAGAAAAWYGTSEDVHDLRGAVEAMHESEQRFRRLADELPLTVWMTDRTGATVYLSPHWARFTGEDDVMGDRPRWLALVHPEDQHYFDAVIAQKMAGEPYEFDFRLRHVDGTWRWIMNSGRPRFSESGVLLGHIGSLIEITDRKLAEQALDTLQRRVEHALDSSGVSVWEWDAVRGSGWWLNDSDAMLPAITGASPDGPDAWLTTVHEVDRAAMRVRFRAYLRGGTEPYECEIRIAVPGGGWRWVLIRGAAIRRDAAGRPLRVSGTLSDIDQRKRAEERLQWTVNHDILTGLPNRRLSQDRLQAALATAAGATPPHRIALALLDLDRFKEVNDAYGHGTGDALLKEFARRLEAFLGAGESASRLGGDEFTLLIPDCGSDAAVEHRIATLAAALAQPFSFEGHRLDCRASVGVSCYPEHGTDAAILLKNADLAMYRAKASGRGAIARYRPELRTEIAERAAILERVRDAIAAGDLVPFYQAQLSLDTGRVVGFEALLRIRNPDGSYSPPASIEEALHDAEVGVAIGAAMLDGVVSDLLRWEQAGVAVGYVAVNVSAAELRRSDYAERVLATLAAAGVPPERLHIEVTESVFLDRDAKDVEHALTTLSAAGIRLALDDFGTGFASLSHLKRLPIDILKIDRSFIRDVENDRDNTVIVDAIIGLARGLGMTVIAEGVETPGQAALLRAKGCDLVQGFHYHRPGPASAVAAALRIRTRASGRRPAATAAAGSKPRPAPSVPLAS